MVGRWNSSLSIGAGFLLGAVFETVAFGWWPDVGDENGIPAHPFWRFIWQWQTLITGIAAGAAALFAAYLAWRGVQAQIAAEAARHRQEATERGLSVLDTLQTSLINLGIRLIRSQALSPANRDFSTASALLIEAMKADLRIGTALAGCLFELEETKTRPKAAGIRCLILARAIGAVSGAIAEDAPLPDPLISDEDVAAVRREWEAEPDHELLWAKQLLIRKTGTTATGAHA